MTPASLVARNPHRSGWSVRHTSCISSRRERTIFLTIVVVDDSADYREIVRYLLASVSDVRIVGEAADGEEALVIVHRERPDIVITDLMMPRLNGIELTRHIRQELPGTRVILMSSYTEEAYRLMASDGGADVFVSKRVIYDALLPAIRNLMARRVVQTPTLGDVLYANKKAKGAVHANASHRLYVDRADHQQSRNR